MLTLSTAAISSCQVVVGLSRSNVLPAVLASLGGHSNLEHAKVQTRVNTKSPDLAIRVSGKASLCKRTKKALGGLMESKKQIAHVGCRCPKSPTELELSGR
jgi:hypothetical protein